ncbi:hypothetical protein ACF0H5_000249 [Mactra antiquata]
MEEVTEHEEEDLSSRSLTELSQHVLQNKHLVKLFVDYNNVESLPDDFGKSLTSLKVFSVIGNDLKHLPDSFGKLSKLEEAYFNENGLINLPDSICELNNLIVLKLTGNQLEMLPDNFGNISKLQVLLCDENKLQCLPKTFGLLEALEELELGFNKIQNLSDGCGNLKSLKILNFYNNQLSALPDSFGNLPNLRMLDLSRNRLKHLPNNFNSSRTLEKLYINRNILEILPSWINDLPNCIELSIKDNHLQEEPLLDSFSLKCSKLKHLNMSGNSMLRLPDTLGELHELEELYLGSVIGELERRNFQNGNWLVKLPMSVCFMSNLRVLNVEENQLNELPNNFGDLISLEILELGQNMLHTLPDSFGNLRSLRICTLSKNLINWLPSNFGELSSLEDLRLDNNELAELPESFCKLSSLKTLDLFSNRLTEIPSALQHLKNLVRLDMECNDIQLPLCDIPQIVTRSNYPERDPNLANDWKGRPRQDITNLVIKKQENVDGIDDFEPPAPDLNYNENCLMMAMKRSMSIWKSHADCESDVRRKPSSLRKSSRKQYDSALSGNDDDDYDDNYDNGVDDGSGTDYDNVDDEDSNDDDDENFEPPLFIKQTEWSGTGLTKSSQDGNTETQSFAQGMLEQTECWDDEIDDVYDQFADANTSQNIETFTYEPELNGEFFFGPFDIHQQHYVKKPMKYDVDNDQFDNCDADDTCDINVDPVF